MDLSKSDREKLKRMGHGSPLEVDTLSEMMEGTFIGSILELGVSVEGERFSLHGAVVDGDDYKLLYKPEKGEYTISMKGSDFRRYAHKELKRIEKEKRAKKSK